jgi:hypothetical protein
VTDARSRVVALLRADFAEEASAGFPRLRRIPCTYFIRFLDYFASLDRAAQDALLDGMARFGSAVFFPDAGMTEYEERRQHPALRRFDAMLQSAEFTGGYRYVDVKSLCMVAKTRELGGLAGWINSRGFSGLALEPREDLLPDLRYLQPPKAAALRKLVDAAFRKLFGAEMSSAGGGNWRFAGSLGEDRLTVWLDLGSQVSQLRYGVTVENPAHTIRVVRTAYESLWVHHLGWDYLTEENAARSVDLLAEQVIYIGRLAERLNRPSTRR